MKRVEPDLRLFVELESLEIQKLSGIEKYKAISRLAVNYRQLQNYQEAHKLFQIASEHFEMHHPLLEMINSLRWADVFRFENRFDEAWTLLEKTQKLISFHQISDYKDFYLQHLGKFYFDQSDYIKALECFKQALEIRQTKNNLELITSTEFAIKMTEKKLGP